MKPLSLYIDTSVIGGYFDPEFTIATRELWRQMEKGQYRFYASTISVGEVTLAPDEVRTLMANTFADPGSILPLTPEAARRPLTTWRPKWSRFGMPRMPTMWRWPLCTKWTWW